MQGNSLLLLKANHFICVRKFCYSPFRVIYRVRPNFSKLEIGFVFYQFRKHFRRVFRRPFFIQQFQDKIFSALYFHFSYQNNADLFQSFHPDLFYTSHSLFQAQI